MRLLDAICERFAPGAIEQGVSGAVLDAIEHDLTARERQRLLLLLRTWLPGSSRSTVAAAGLDVVVLEARLGGSPELAAAGPTGETWDVGNLVVADGSAFPTASGVNR